jgi:hypothetical protein
MFCVELDVVNLHTNLVVINLSVPIFCLKLLDCGLMLYYKIIKLVFNLNKYSNKYKY